MDPGGASLGCRRYVLKSQYKLANCRADIKDQTLPFSTGIRKFGKNFKVIAEIIGTKTESHLRSFFVNYRRKYNLDAALKDYEAEHGTADDEVSIALCKKM